MLDEGAYPDELYTRLSGTNTKLQVLKAGFQESALMRRFVAAIEKKKNYVFDGVLQEHRGMMISGRPYTIDELREFLAYVHATQAIKEEEPVIRGLATIEMCQYCRKTGHNEKQCWKKNERTKTSKVKECWQCGKKGHISKNCRRNKNVTGKAAAITKTDKVEDRKFNYLDSACSEHIVASKNLIQNMHEVEETIVRSANGEPMILKYKGTRTINTKQGPLKLSEVYYCDKLEYNLISVAKLADKNITVKFIPEGAYLEKETYKIHLIRNDRLWILPEKEYRTNLKAANLRMHDGGIPVSDLTWHERLGHPSETKTKVIIQSKMIPGFGDQVVDQSLIEGKEERIPARR